MHHLLNVSTQMCPLISSTKLVFINLLQFRVKERWGDMMDKMVNQVSHVLEIEIVNFTLFRFRSLVVLQVMDPTLH